MSSDFALSLLVGQTTEQAIKDQIKRRYSVVMTAQIANGANGGPRMENDGKGVVLADMQLYGGVRRGWVEIKAKSGPNFRRDRNRQEHGVDLSKWREYIKLQNETKQAVYLVICEINGDLLMQDLSTLSSQGKPRKGIWSGADKRESINFDRRTFARIGNCTVPAGDLRRLTIEIDWQKFETFCTQPMLIECE